MMPEFVYEYMEQRESPRLSFRKPAKDCFFGSVARNSQPRKYLFVRIKITGPEFDP